MPGPGEPDAISIVPPTQLIVDELLELNDGVLMEVFGTGEQLVKARIYCLSADTPARSTCMGFPHKNHTHGCNYCKVQFLQLPREQGQFLKRCLLYVSPIARLPE